MYLVDTCFSMIAIFFSYIYIYKLKQIFEIYVSRKGSKICKMNEIYDWRASANLVWRRDIGGLFYFQSFG